MPLRDARFSDHQALAEICSAAFFNEDLFGRVIHPHRYEFPHDPTVFWLQHIRNHWFDWRNRMLITYNTDSLHTSSEIITGLAVWQRQGKGGEKLALRTWDPRNIAIPLTKLSNRLTSLIYPNRALDPTKTTILQHAMPFSAHHWSCDRQENWYLALCAVHPDHQGQGFGRQLVEWGLREAEKENVHASVMSSDGKTEFYLRCGFQEVVGNANEGEGNPLVKEGVKGGDIIFKFPKVGE
ncbi:hypothetical protein B0J11DRAFT_525333 [Dendryphion nanum]|uniref:N-acetyltransferase domain-containing protein n=1 Tax=Dendryphion nanum TaxID=256645 RepID=A0A9P9IRM1_9PLEO|nr:hypothetical protein B0J11DRAFT_525333 [Dendryphion nanum]